MDLNLQKFLKVHATSVVGVCAGKILKPALDMRKYGLCLVSSVTIAYGIAAQGIFELSEILISIDRDRELSVACTTGVGICLNWRSNVLMPWGSISLTRFQL